MSVRSSLAAVFWIVLAATAGMQTHPAGRPAVSSDRPNFSGDWTLNRELSDEPRPRDPDDEQRMRGARRGGFGGFGGRGEYGRRGGYGGGSPSGRQSAQR